MKIKSLLILLTVLTIGLMACVASSDPVPEMQKSNYLEFTMDGQVWKADNGIFGSYHFSDVLGPDLIQIAGNKGEGKDQQAFNINLFQTTKEGEYIAEHNSTSKSVAQLANLSPSNYLCGGTHLAHKLNVQILKVNKNPQLVEATFSGSLQAVDGTTIQITNGKFYYHE